LNTEKKISRFQPTQKVKPFSPHRSNSPAAHEKMFLGLADVFALLIDEFGAADGTEVPNRFLWFEFSVREVKGRVSTFFSVVRTPWLYLIQMSPANKDLFGVLANTTSSGSRFVS
jgi:hypothetical protein